MVNVATKVNPWYSLEKKSTLTETARGLRKESVLHQMNMSLTSLKVQKVPLLYLHAPDPETPIEETLEALNELYKEGRFAEWGLSNYPAWQVVHIYHLCKEKGYPVPTVYQGMYNYVTRDIEKELLPALRCCGMRFYAYNPLGGGVLTGKYSYEDNPENGRFSGKTVWGNRYRDRFWKKSVFTQLEEVKFACIQNNIEPAEAAIRWLYFHSKLSAEIGDGVLIGGSSLEQIQQNTDYCTKAIPLPGDVLSVIEKSWEVAKADCPPYFR